MSLILDALKRAERERHAERNPALGDVPTGPSRRGATRWRARAVVAAVLLALGALAFWLLRNDRAVPDAAPAPQAVAPEPSTAAPGAPADDETPVDALEEPAPDETPILASPAPAIVPGTEAVTSLDDLTADSEAAPAAPLPDAGAPQTRPLPAPTPAQPQQQQQQRQAQATPVPDDLDTAPLDTGETPETAAPAAPTPVPESRPVPPALTQPVPRRKLREMPPEYRADFPALIVEVHVHERDPARRFVIVNGRRYREGEPLAEGPQLVEIARDGLVLDYRGERVLFTLGR